MADENPGTMSPPFKRSRPSCNPRPAARSMKTTSQWRRTRHPRETPPPSSHASKVPRLLLVNDGSTPKPSNSNRPARRQNSLAVLLYRLGWGPRSVGQLNPLEGRHVTVKSSSQHDGRPSSDLTRSPRIRLADSLLHQDGLRGPSIRWNHLPLAMPRLATYFVLLHVIMSCLQYRITRA